MADPSVTRGWFALTESPAATSTVFTTPAIGNANSTFFTGTTVPDAVATLEKIDGCEPESSDTVGIAVGVADWPQAVTSNCKNTK